MNSSQTGVIVVFVSHVGVVLLAIVFKALEDCFSKLRKLRVRVTVFFLGFYQQEFLLFSPEHSLLLLMIMKERRKLFLTFGRRQPSSFFRRFEQDVRHSRRRHRRSSFRARGWRKYEQ